MEVERERNVEQHRILALLLLSFIISHSFFNYQISLPVPEARLSESRASKLAPAEPVRERAREDERRVH